MYKKTQKGNDKTNKLTTLGKKDVQTHKIS